MISSALSNKILEFIAGQITVAQLEDWLVPNLPTLIREPNSADSDIVSAIELGLSELSLGIQSHNEFAVSLQGILGEHVVVFNFPVASSSELNVTGSSNATLPDFNNWRAIPIGQPFIQQAGH